MNNKLCQRKHEYGQSEIVALCTNINCSMHLMCCFCYSDYHKDHAAKVVLISELKSDFGTQLEEINNFNIEDKIEEIKQDFKDVKGKFNEMVDQVQTQFMSQLNKFVSNITGMLDKFEKQANNNIESIFNSLTVLKHSFQSVLNGKIYELSEQDLKIIIECRQIDKVHQREQAILNLIALNAHINATLQTVVFQNDKRNLIGMNPNLKILYNFHQENHQSTIPLEHSKIKGKYGFLEKPTGVFYRGELNVNQQRHGKGFQMDLCRGILFEGIWSYDTLIHGTQSSQDENGIMISKYGPYKNGLVCGQGQIVKSDGSKYIGAIENDLKHGQGTLTNNGQTQQGVFKDDKQDGKFDVTRKNGLKIVKQFKDGLLEGEQFYYKEQVLQKVKVFAQGKLVSQKKHNH